MSVNNSLDSVLGRTIWIKKSLFMDSYTTTAGTMKY